MGQPTNNVSRRILFAGAGTAGFLAVAAGLAAKAPLAPDAALPDPKPAPERGGGYSLSEHVTQKYRTTRL